MTQIVAARCGLDADAAAALLAAADGDVDTAVAIHVGYNGGDLVNDLGALADAEADKRARPDDPESRRERERACAASSTGPAVAPGAAGAAGAAGAVGAVGADKWGGGGDRGGKDGGGKDGGGKDGGGNKVCGAAGAEAAQSAAAQADSQFLGPDHAQEIWPGLWLGPVGAATSPAERLRMGVSAVVSAMSEAPDLSEAPGLRLLHCSLRDDGNDPAGPHFEAVSSFVECARADGLAVLVHCSSGISRSATLVIAHLMMTRRQRQVELAVGEEEGEWWDLKRSYEHVLSRRACAAPNAQFFANLLALEARLFRERGCSGAYRASMTRSDYDVLSLSSVTGRPAADCRRALAAARNDVNVAVGMLF